MLAGPPLLLYIFCACHQPASLQQYINKQLPGWQIVDTTDYDQSWWSFHERNVTPYHVTVDINDDQLADHALLMKKNNALQLVFIIGKPRNGFTHIVAEDVGGMASGMQMGVAIEPPAQIDVVLDQPKTLMLATNGFALLNLEQKVLVYYWKEGRMASFTMQ